jgi:hypothetical protein
MVAQSIEVRQKIFFENSIVRGFCLFYSFWTRPMGSDEKSPKSLLE